MASPIGLAGSFEVASDANGSSITIRISEGSTIKAENLSLSTWGSSLVLANLLHRFPVTSTAQDASLLPFVLELGAGTGLVGISAGALWHRRVLLTDLPAILPGIAANISLNSHLLSKHHASYGSLDWNRPREVHLPSDVAINSEDFKAEVILAADTIYSEDHPELLVQTIKEWLAPTVSSRAILCYPLRMAYIDHIREFWTLMEASGLLCAEEGREAGDENWNELSHTPYEWCVWRWKSATHAST